MRTPFARTILLAFFGLAVAPALSAQLPVREGEVLIATRESRPQSAHDARNVYGHLPPGSFVSRFHTTGFNGEFKWVPADSAERLLVPSPSRWIFWTEGEIGSWDGVDRSPESNEAAYTPIATASGPVSNFIELPSGHFLVAEQWSATQPKLIEMNSQAVVQERVIGGVQIAVDRLAGASAIALRGDGCTLLYVDDDELATSRIHQLNLCTSKALDDFAAMPAGSVARSLRVLPAGNVVVATDLGLLEFDTQGRIASVRDCPGARRVALSPDAKTIWVAGNDDFLYLASFPVADAAAPATRLLLDYLPRPDEEVADIAVVGEWQPWASSPRRNRAVRR